MIAEVTARPFLKWVGGKRQLLPQILARMPMPTSWGSYHEPFLGGGALFWELAARGHLKGKRVFLSDANARLIRTYVAVRDDVEDVIDRLRAMPYEKDFFYATRGRDIDRECNVEVAAWLIYLNRACFNGLYRVNLAGRFNVPFGKYANPVICDAENLRACSRALADVTLRCGEFETRHVDRGGFAYCDPPYAPLSATSDFTRYQAAGFSARDQEALRDRALVLLGTGRRILVSNSSAPLIRSLYGRRGEFDVREVLAKRAVNSKAEGRGAVKELLIS